MSVLLALAAALVAAAPAQPAERWAAAGFADYDFRLRVRCGECVFGHGPYTIHVRDGRAQDGPESVRDLATVPRLLAYAQRDVDRGLAGARVEYGQRGVPRYVYNGGSMAGDGGIVVRTSRLRPSDRPFRVVDSDIQDGRALFDLRRAKRMWARTGASDYSYRLRGTQEPRPRTVVVRDRIGDPTVPDLFALVRDAIRRRVAELEFSYRGSGLPRVVAIDGVTWIASRLRPRGLRAAG